MAKVCVIGLDGGSLRVIDFLMAANRLPNLSKISREGSRATLMSTIPPLTPAAWASFYTGMNPGKHGVVDFFTRMPGSYRLSPINATRVGGTPIWSLASDYGLRTCIYNVPMTYPACPVNGVMISGMDTPRLDDLAIYPADFSNKLLKEISDFSIEPRVDVKYLVNNHPDPVGEYIEKLKGYLLTETRTIRYLMQIEDWNLFVGVIRTADIFQHVFWESVDKVISGNDSVSNDDNRRAEAVFSCYEALDRELGEMDGWSLILMSDHGFGHLKADVCLNRTLSEAGLLKFKKKSFRRRSKEYVFNTLSPRIPPESRWKIKRYLQKDYETGRGVVLFVDALVADIDWSQTRIYSLAQFGCLYTNYKGREPMGIVKGEKERQAVLAEAEAALSEIRDPDNGEPVVTEFHRREDLYHGALEKEMPDMVLVMRDYAYRAVYSTYSELAEEPIIRTPFRERKQLTHTGNHRREGMLFLHGPGIRHVDLGVANMVDIAPTVMTLLGLPVQDYYDGKVLDEALQDSIREKVSVEQAEDRGKKYSHAEPEKVLSEEDEEEVRKRLEDLGYL